MSLSSFRPLIPQPLQQCLSLDEQVFYKKHHERVRQNHVFVYYLMLFVFGIIGLIFLYGSWMMFMESQRTARSSSGLRSVAFVFLFLSMLFFGVFGYFIRELKIKKEIERMMKKCSR